MQEEEAGQDDLLEPGAGHGGGGHLARGEVATTDCDNNNNNGVYSMLPVSTHELVSCPLFIVRCVNINIINLNKINSTIPVRLLILIT